MQRKKGIDISQIKGSGENGRIIKRDLNNFNTKNTEEKIVSTNDMTMQPLSQMRKTIASRLSQSKFTAPHFYLTSELM